MTQPDTNLEAARKAADLSLPELWFRYFALGGLSTTLEIEAYLLGALIATIEDQDLLAVAINERFSELGGDHPIPYSDDPAFDG
ncbi:MAG: hypothetical protein ABIP21_07225 [Acidimicrobiia bacterium]